MCPQRSERVIEGEKQEAMEEEEEEAKVSDVSLKGLSKKLDEFAKERDWEQYHSPRNLLLAMVSSHSSCSCMSVCLCFVCITFESMFLILI